MSPFYSVPDFPEIMRLIKQGKLAVDFRLCKAHLLMYADESQNEIPLNDEVRFTGHVLFEEGKSFSVGKPVAQDDIKDILGLYPSNKIPPNAAHVMLVKLKSKWYYAVDLIYDRDKVKRRFETAKDFLTVSNYCLKCEHWAPFAGTLFSATELAIQSILLLQHHPTFSTNQDHPETVELFSSYAKNGNMDTKFSIHYVNLFHQDLRLLDSYCRNVFLT